MRGCAKISGFPLLAASRGWAGRCSCPDSQNPANVRASKCLGFHKHISTRVHAWCHQSNGFHKETGLGICEMNVSVGKDVVTCHIIAKHNQEIEGTVLQVPHSDCLWPLGFQVLWLAILSATRQVPQSDFHPTKASPSIIGQKLFPQRWRT